METPTTTAPVHESLLTKIGHGFQHFFGIAIAAASVAQPIINALNPEAGAILNVTVSAVMQAEAAAAAAGQQDGTGPQKLAYATQAVEPILVAYFQKQFPGTVFDKSVTVNLINAVVAALKAIPAASVPASPTPAA